eukprot:scaffold241_cov229-Prasinococcus_capsulatus_cf.AAC.2
MQPSQHDSGNEDRLPRARHVRRPLLRAASAAAQGDGRGSAAHLRALGIEADQSHRENGGDDVAARVADDELRAVSACSERLRYTLQAHDKYSAVGELIDLCEARRSSSGGAPTLDPCGRARGRRGYAAAACEPPSAQQLQRHSLSRAALPAAHLPGGSTPRAESPGRRERRAAASPRRRAAPPPPAARPTVQRDTAAHAQVSGARIDAACGCAVATTRSSAGASARGVPAPG